MDLIRIDRNPSTKMLRQFGLSLLILCAVVAGIVWWKLSFTAMAVALLAVGVVALLVGLIAPKVLRPVYVAWMITFFPVAWTVSHTTLLLIYYLVFTPVGLVMRLVGYDPLKRKWDRRTTTYWEDHDPPAKPSRYFRQF